MLTSTTNRVRWLVGITFGALVATSTVLPSSAVVVQAKEESCKEKEKKEKIKHIAREVVANRETDDVRSCYSGLADEDKALVFEDMAIERGISVDELRQETDQDRNNRNNSSNASLQLSSASMPLAGTPWQQAIERYGFSAVGKTLRSVTRSYTDALCDGDGTDTDYVFVIAFPYNQSNPDSLRAFSYSVGVDAMLVYYQGRDRGINGRGRTDSRDVSVCLGDTGVATAGGQSAVQSGLKLHDNN